MSATKKNSGILGLQGNICDILYYCESLSGVKPVVAFTFGVSIDMKLNINYYLNGISLKETCDLRAFISLMGNDDFGIAHFVQNDAQVSATRVSQPQDQYSYVLPSYLP